MKFLLVNKFFFRNGGSEACFFDTARLLESKGHEVAFVAMDDPRNEPGDGRLHLVSHVDFSSAQPLRERVRAAARMLYSREARAVMDAAIRRERPDVALLHNVYHQLSPSILEPLARHGVPALLTLHDYKVVCPVYTLSCRGEPCRRCSGRAFHRCARHRCSRGSLSASVLAAAEMTLHHRILDVYRRVDTFVCPSRFLMETVRAMGFGKRLALLPNFVDAAAIRPREGVGDGSLVYVGRLTPEKGVRTLLRAMEGVPAPCRIIGDGPLREELEDEAQRRGLDNVAFLGHLPFPEVAEHVSRARAAVVPSEWYENSPRSVLEAFALGTPVIGARIGGIPELVRDGETGWLFRPGDADDLRRAILSSLAEADTVGAVAAQARTTVEQVFDPETHYAGLMALCRAALERT